MILTCLLSSLTVPGLTLELIIIFVLFQLMWRLHLLLLVLGCCNISSVCCRTFETSTMSSANCRWFRDSSSIAIPLWLQSIPLKTFSRQAVMSFGEVMPPVWLPWLWWILYCRFGGLLLLSNWYRYLSIYSHTRSRLLVPPRISIYRQFQLNRKPSHSWQR